MNKRILVVDDDLGIVMFLKRILEREGYEVTTVEDSAWALAEFQAGGHDLVLTDKSMPGMDGLQLIEVIRGFSPKTPTILHTTESAELTMCDLSKVTKVLAKPAGRKEILLAVEEALQAGSTPPA